MAEKHHITETPDTSYIKNIDVTHETSDVYIGGIAKFVLGLFVLLVVSFVLMLGMFKLLNSQPVPGEKPRSKIALTEKERLPPEPRLQSAPGFAEELEKTAARNENKAESHEQIKSAPDVPRGPMFEIEILHKQWDDVLKNGPVDEAGKRYGMPIEQAKQEVLKQLAAKDQRTWKQLMSDGEFTFSTTIADRKSSRH